MTRVVIICEGPMTILVATMINGLRAADDAA